MNYFNNMEQNKSFAIHTLGCKVNTYESDAMAAALKAAGFAERSFDEKADLYIINTCTVTNIADRKSRQMLRRARRLNPEALVAAAGCYVDDAIKNQALQELLDNGVIDIAIPNKDKKNVVSVINNYIQGRECSCTDEKTTLNNNGEAVLGGTAEEGIEGTIGGNTAGTAKESIHASAGKAAENEDAPQVSPYLTELDGHTRAFIKVQDGCNMFCTYCIIPYVRGRLTARPVPEVLEEIRRLADRGVAETVITGIHLSSLGDGILEILEGIEKIDGILRVRLGSLEPRLITERFAGELKRFDKLCPHFHLSLQSGSDEILRRMNRHYTAEEYAESCDILRANYEHPAITTDIIVGFPGETEEHFRETLAFAERIGFYEAHVFKYSRRRGTPADRMDGQLTEAVKAARSEELIRATERLSEEFRRYYVGRDCGFLSEELVEIGGRLYETGYNREYVRCLKESKELHLNTVQEGRAVRLWDTKTPLGSALLLE